MNRELPDNPVRGLGLGRPSPRLLRSAVALWGNATGSRERVVRFQQARLRDLLRFAAAKVPYYRAVFKRHGVDPERTKPIDALEALPPLQRMALRELPQAELMPFGRTTEGLLPERSSGSTGVRLSLFKDPAEAHLLQLFRMRMWRQAGIGFRDRSANLLGVFAESTKPLGTTVWRERLGLFPSQNFDTTQSVSNLIEQLVEYQPQVVSGYPSVVHQLALNLGAPPEQRITPKRIVTGGEMLNSAMREAVEGCFRVKVVNTYGAMEFNLLGSQCPESELIHVCDDAVRIEILSGGRPVKEGELGEVVVTGLHSFTFPLIRYRLGDLAIKGPDQCPCGAPFSTIREIRGRIMEYFYAIDGTPIHHWAANKRLLWPTPELRERNQIIQWERDRIEMKLVASRPLADADHARIQCNAREIFGADMRFELNLVESIPCSSSGKLIKSINHYRSPWAGQQWDPTTLDVWDPSSQTASP